jgi:murein L,D-transpeptidase YcbB/YkuD
VTYLTKQLLILALFGSLLFAETFPSSNHISNAIKSETSSKSRPFIEQLYRASHFKTIWVDQKEKLNALVKALSDIKYNYKNLPLHREILEELLEDIDNEEIEAEALPQALAKADVLLSEAFVYLVHFIVSGNVDWKLVEKKIRSLKSSENIKAKWEIPAKKRVNTQTLVHTALKGNIEKYLDSLLPMKERYLKLVGLLERYQDMERFPRLRYSNRVLEKGDRSAKVSRLKYRLQVTGDYTGLVDDEFDRRLVEALTRFQKRYLIEVTGKLDKITTYYLNLSRESRVQAIKTNLDKTKLYPKRFESEHIEVNIPEFMMRYYVRYDLQHKANLIVGRIDRPTPLFSDRIQYMVLNPTWSIPTNLVKKDLIPVLRENPNYMTENHIYAYSGNKRVNVTYGMLKRYEKSQGYLPYRFVQKPGEHNALGKVKFMFPNKYAVYLHDTDDRSLFNRRYKIYSSGCMRIEEPFVFAKKLLKYTSISHRRFDTILEKNQPTTVKLNKSIPIHILYFTVFEDEEGIAHFKNDIYLYDKIIEESTYSNRKTSFKVPEKRMITIKPVSNRVSN